MGQWIWDMLVSGAWAASLLGLAGFLFQATIKTRLENVVKAVYAKRLAELNSQLRRPGQADLIRS